MNVSDAPLYLQNALSLFIRMGLSRTYPNYFIHNPAHEYTRIGIGSDSALPKTAFRSSPQGTRLEVTESLVSFCEKSLARTDRGTPTFIMISPDEFRDAKDTRIPAVLSITPLVEVSFTPSTPNGAISYSDISIDNSYLGELLEAPLEDGHGESLLALASAVPASQYVSQTWIKFETDDNFLDRLRAGIQILQDFPDGKMAMMRSFEKDSIPDLDYFLAFIRQVLLGGDFALGHFVSWQRRRYAFGCSPENVFEINGDSISIDVVAGTCPASISEELERQLLTENPKQLKEHMSSYLSRSKRYASYTKSLELNDCPAISVRRLSNVSHLHSRIYGTLLPGVTAAGILPFLMPLLGARPSHLLPLSDSDGSPHRFYGGAVGYRISSYEGFFLNLRSACVLDGVIYAKVGVGILKESDAYAELKETDDKIAGLMEAISETERRHLYGTVTTSYRIRK